MILDEVICSLFHLQDYNMGNKPVKAYVSFDLPGYGRVKKLIDVTNVTILDTKDGNDISAVCVSCVDGEDEDSEL